MNETTTSLPNGPLARWLEHGTKAPSLPSILPSEHAVLSILSLLAIFGLLVVGLKVIRARHQRDYHAEGWAIEIALPPSVDGAGAAVLWTSLHDQLRPRWSRFWHGQPHVVWELVWNPDMHVRIWAPNVVSKVIVRSAVEAAWPGALVSDLKEPIRVADADDEPQKQSTNQQPLKETVVVGGQFRLSASDWFPIKSDFDADPMRSIIGAVGVLDQTEGAVVQVLTRPVTAYRMTKCRKAAQAIMTGKSTSLMLRLLDVVTPGQRPTTVPDVNKSADLAMVRKKATSLGWETVIRYGVSDSESGATDAQLKERAHGLASAFALFSGRNRFSRKRLRSVGNVLESRALGKGDLLSVEELSAVAHLPTDQVLPGVMRAGARAVEPGPLVPSIGKVLGKSEGNHSRDVAIAPDDARYHLHMLGSTGSGKSTLITNMVLQDVAENRGAVVIDPKGDLINDILDRLPEEAHSRVVLIDPVEKDAPPTMNVLQGEDPDLVVDHLVGIFRRIFQAYWGPRTDDVLRSVCLTLLTQEHSTLIDVPRLLTEPNFRASIVAGLNDPYGLEVFWDWYDEMSPAQQGQVVGPVMNKLRAFLLRPFIRKMMEVSESSFDMNAILDGGLLLVRVPKGIVGDETSKLVGSFIVSKVWQAATARAAKDGINRNGASLYIDECHNFLNLPNSVDEMLAEARGYGLSIVLAHQHLGQLSRELRDAISANARNKILFNMSPEDARTLERHVSPELSMHDLSHLGAYQAAVRVVRNGLEQPACTIRTEGPSSAQVGNADLVREAARINFGMDADQRAKAEQDRTGEQPSDIKGDVA